MTVKEPIITRELDDIRKPAHCDDCVKYAQGCQEAIKRSNPTRLHTACWYHEPEEEMP